MTGKLTSDMNQYIELSSNGQEGFHICWGCKEIKSLESFAPSRISSKTWTCRDCSHRVSMANYNRKRDYVIAVKLEFGCADCGYCLHPAALEFDHLPGSDKVARIAQMVSSASLERIIAEIAKCEVVCSNCHAIRTSNRYARLVSSPTKDYVRSIKESASCIDCGYTNWIALEFDHLPGTTKDDKIANMFSRSLEDIQAEIDKCEIVCSNCHAIRGAERDQSAQWWAEWRDRRGLLIAA